MAEDKTIVAGIEIGTSKICVVVGAIGADGSVNLIGIGQATSSGVRKGEIIDPPVAARELREALAEAERMADAEIRQAMVGVTGIHLRSQNHRGFHRVFGSDQEIRQDDVDNVVENALAASLPADHSVLHSIRQGFVVDGEEGVTNPVGMHGTRLEVDFHLIHGKTTRLQNPVRLVKGTSLEIEEIIFNGLASALAVLSPEQKELGALVIDLGGGTTEYVVVAEGVVRHTGVLAVGGDHVTNDLAYGLELSLTRAEKLKQEHGTALVNEAERERLIEVKDGRGMTIMQVNAWQAQRIIAARMEETLEIIRDDVAAAGLLPRLRAGVVLCGGGSALAGITELAGRVFQKPATRAHIQGVAGMNPTLDEPAFATAIGLVKYAAMRERRTETPETLWHKFKAWLASVFQRP
jgi:cell division protein FtsA